MTDKSHVAKLRRAALNLLARRDYSRHEMATKLLRKAALLQADASKKPNDFGIKAREEQKQKQNKSRCDDLGFDQDDLEIELGIAGAGAATATATESVKVIAEDQSEEDDVYVDIGVHVEPVLDWLTEHNFLNDQRFIEAYIRYGIGRGHGLMRIRQDLQRKGIEQTLLADTLEPLETDWFELAADLRQRRFGASPPKSDQKERARQMRFLQYRGFSLDQCFYALSRESDNDR